MSQVILRTEGLKSFYILDVHGTQKVVKAVNGVDIEIQEDEVYGIAGKSGCGKTTLQKTLVVLSNRGNLRLLQHNLTDPRLVEPWRRAPGQVASMRVEPV